MSNTAQAEARKPEVRPARVWQPTDLLHPIAPAGGFLPNPWQPTQSAGFDPQGFVTPVLDLQTMAREAAAKAAAAQAAKLEAARAANSGHDASQDGADAISQDDPSDTASAAPSGDDAHTRPDSDVSDDASVPDPSTTARSDLIAPASPALDAQAVEQARAQGHAQGMAEAHAQLQAQAKAQAQAQAELAKDTALLDKLQVALDDLQQHPQSFFEPLKRLSLHLAEQLVLAELQLDGSAIERLVQRCVDDLGQHDESMVTVNLHPSDVERLHSMRERTGLNEGSSLRLQADESLLPGSVRASANDAIVEDLIAERLSTLARGLHIDEPRWSAQSAFSAARIAADRLPNGRVEDAQPRMAAAPSAVVAASLSPTLREAAADSIDGADDAPQPVHAQSGYDTVAAIDEILNDENHV